MHIHMLGSGNNQISLFVAIDKSNVLDEFQIVCIALVHSPVSFLHSPVLAVEVAVMEEEVAVGWVGVAVGLAIF